jgi:hypothetical protein
MPEERGLTDEATNSVANQLKRIEVTKHHIINESRIIWSSASI